MLKLFHRLHLLRSFVYNFFIHQQYYGCGLYANYQKKEDFIDNWKYFEVDNKIRYIHQEETFMNGNVMFNIISEIIFQTALPYILIMYIIYQFRNKEYYIINITLIMNYVAYICNILILFQILNLVFAVKQKYSHLNKRLTS